MRHALSPLEPSNLCQLIAKAIGHEPADFALSVLELDRIPRAGIGMVSRGELAMALNAALFCDLLDRVPQAARYVARVADGGRRVRFDHGALRTIDGETGVLPRGHLAFARVLEPLGYAVADLYPLPRLKMTGRAYRHVDMPEAIPQFFVSELHVAELDDEARQAAARVFGASADPLGECESRALDRLGRDGACPFDIASCALPGLVRAFSRHHPVPLWDDYETLLRHSAEAAWIATEGNAFNHATDRVFDVAALASHLKAEGVPMKDEVEVSASGRVRQTAMLAAPVEREFRAGDGSTVRRKVPGSFYEFISRDVDPATGRLDLSFDSGNATGIFGVTGAS